jgi:ectoine hydroxylase-related dioxygenase (phytanoyl-CoA dioxygenase family)
MTAWVALTPANLKNGCMKFVPGSQTQDHLQHVDTFHKDNLLSRGQEIAVKVDTENTIDCILNPGEMSLHHVKLVHGSEPNRSNDRRIGLAIRYIPTDVRQLKVRDSAMLVRGVDREGNFDHEPRPRHDLDDNALAAHADAVGRQVKALYSGTDKQEFRA